MKKIIVMGLMGLIVYFSSCLEGWGASNCSDGGDHAYIGIITPTIGTKIYVTELNVSVFSGFRAKQSWRDNEKLTWTVGKFNFHPDYGNTGIGISPHLIKIGIAEWPAKHDDIFGKQNVELEYVGGTGNCKAEVEVEVFFPLEEVSGGDRLWYKYWVDEHFDDWDLVDSIVINGSSKAAAYNPTTIYSASGGLVLTITQGDTEGFLMAKSAYEEEQGIYDTIATYIAHEYAHQVYQVNFNAHMQVWWAGLSACNKTKYYDDQTLFGLGNGDASFDAAFEAFRVLTEAYAEAEQGDCDDYKKTGDWRKGGINDV